MGRKFRSVSLSLSAHRTVTPCLEKSPPLLSPAYKRHTQIILISWLSDPYHVTMYPFSCPPDLFVYTLHLTSYLFVVYVYTSWHQSSLPHSSGLLLRRRRRWQRSARAFVQNLNKRTCWNCEIVIVYSCFLWRRPIFGTKSTAANLILHGK